jgi:hypothetical protein
LLRKIKNQKVFPEEMVPLTTKTLMTIVARIVPPTIREEEEVQIGSQPTAEPILKHPRVMGPEIVDEEKTAVPIGSA